MRTPIAAALILLLGACAAPSTLPSDLAERAGAGSQELLLLGEQHDAAGHRRLQRLVIETLASRDRLAAVAVEMAEQGGSTAGLGPTATEEQVRSALHWNEAGWSWPTYAPVVMAAVRAGVPVLGANLPRSQMAAAMGDSSLDAKLPGPALNAQQQAIRTGHCGLLPESQVAPMTRIQIARDRSMAQVLEKAVVPGKTVVLIAGNGHVDPALGIPQHLPANLHAQTAALPPEPQKKDYCAEMRGKMQRAAVAAR
ncbi:MAG: hypothetical protein JWP43_1699 [Ramlibacter sp.]|jgi:uncharacterized iron-regulated protein|nr:hypothetical protein [Ramlibacter sp.]